MSSTVNKKMLIDSVSTKLDLTKKLTGEVLETLLDVMASELKKGNKVDLAGFGRFEVKKRNARNGINPATKEKIKIAASKSVGFKVAKNVKDSLNKKK